MPQPAARLGARCWDVLASLAEYKPAARNLVFRKPWAGAANKSDESRGAIQGHVPQAVRIPAPCASQEYYCTVRASLLGAAVSSASRRSLQHLRIT